VLKGKCLCEAVQYETTGSPFAETNCHCSICRRASGASPVAWFTVPASSFRFVIGNPHQYKSSAKGVRKFCGDCGTQLTFQSHESSTEIDVTTCSLDDPDIASPKSHIYTSSKLGWVALMDKLPIYKEGRSE
jgi:hypothetical protein